MKILGIKTLACLSFAISFYQLSPTALATEFDEEETYEDSKIVPDAVLKNQWSIWDGNTGTNPSTEQNEHPPEQKLSELLKMAIVNYLTKPQDFENN